MTTFKAHLLVSVIGLTLGCAGANASAIYYYANWTSGTLSSLTNGSASGIIATSQGMVNVSYTGDVAAPTQVNNIGYDYFSSYAAIYSDAAVSNKPLRVDIIALSQSHAFADTLTFSTPVTNPILDIVSLGSVYQGTTYVFNATPTILSQGSGAYGGCNTCLSVSGRTLTGHEGDGVVQFLGTYSQLSWTTAGGEYWNGFTVGVAGLAGNRASDGDTASPTPEPATWVNLLISALLMMPYLFRNRKRHGR